MQNASALFLEGKLLKSAKNSTLFILPTTLLAMPYKDSSQLFITFANAKTKLNCIYLNISTGNVV